MDLLVYAIKYMTYLRDVLGESPPPGVETWSDGLAGFNRTIEDLPDVPSVRSYAQATAVVTEAFQKLEQSFECSAGVGERQPLVWALAVDAWALLWAMVSEGPLEAKRLIDLGDDGIFP